MNAISRRFARKAARQFVEVPETKKLTVDAPDISGYLGARKLLPDRIYENDEVGVVNGLAYTELGGDMLRIEALVFDGSGKLELTGSLGDVMKESAHIAVSFVRSRARELESTPISTKTRTYIYTCRRARYPKTVRPPESRWSQLSRARCRAYRCAATVAMTGE